MCNSLFQDLFENTFCYVYFFNSLRITHLLPSHGEGGIEPLFECAAALEDGGQQEVEEGPELRQLVLQRSACQQHTPWSQVVRVQDLGQLTVVVLHSMALVHNHVLPTKLWKEIQK